MTSATAPGALRHLISIEDLDRDRLTTILDTTQQLLPIAERRIKSAPTLRGHGGLQPLPRGLDAHPHQLRHRRQAVVGRGHQLLRQGQLGQQGGVVQGHRPDPRGHGGRRGGGPQRLVRRAGPARELPRRPGPQRRGRVAPASDPGVARRVHDAPAPRPSGPGAPDRARGPPPRRRRGRAAQPGRPQPRPGGEALRHGGDPGGAADAAAAVGRGLGGAGRPRPRRGPARGRRGRAPAGPARTDAPRVLPDHAGVRGASGGSTPGGSS